MNRQNALKHLMFDHHVPSNKPASKKYGRTKLARSICAWDVALELSKGNERKVTASLLDEIIESVDKGDNVIDAFFDDTWVVATEKRKR